MALVVDHSDNFPRVFAQCGLCSKRLVYTSTPFGEDQQIQIRCKGCGTTKFVAAHEYLGLSEEANLIGFGGQG